VERLDSKSERTRRRVLRAAAEAFRRHGFASVTLKDIAGLADLQPGSLYYHFDSKEAIVAAVLEAGIRRSFEATRRAVEALPEGTDAADRLRTAIAAHLHSLLTDSHYAAANLRILGQVPEAVRQHHLVSQREYGAYWKGLLQAAADTGAIRSDTNLSLVRMLLFGAMNWSVEWYHESGEPPEAIARQLSSTVLEGLLPRTDE
jgi:AcrR family transcriptional regulator